MKIKMMIPGRRPVTINREGPLRLEALAEEYKDKMKYTPMLAKVDGVERSLAAEIERDCTVEFVDASTQSGNLVYQHSLTMVFLKAVKNVLGSVPVHVHNPLNKGVFITIDSGEELLDSTLNTIKGLMEEYIRRDLPIEEKYLPREKAIETLREFGYEDKARLVEQAKGVHKVSFHHLGDYVNSFYGVMVPSTKYVDKFQLMKYREGLILRFPYTDDPDVMPEYRDDVNLYEAFAKEQEWNDLLGIRCIPDLNDVIRSGKTRDMILLSEALHEKRVAEIADMIVAAGKRIVLIAGPSSSGKTSFANRLCIQLRVAGVKPLYMGTDDYFVERENTPLGEDGKPDYENLDAMEVQLFNDNMNDLLSGKEVDMPTFNFITGKKEFGKRFTKIDEDTVVVVEGIHALNEAMSVHIKEKDKFKIYISPLLQLSIDIHNRISTTDARKLRRMVRDYKHRGYDAEKTIEVWPKVRAGEDKNIFPYNGEADVVFNSATVYELAVLKRHAQPLLETVPETSPAYGEAKRLLQFLRYFDSLKGERYIPNNSILREFIGGSILLEE